MRRAAVAAMMLLGSGCVSGPSFLAPAPQRAWPTVLADAREAVSKGQYADADGTLLEFERSYPGTTEANEARYWRALILLDPANRGGNPSDASAELDAYLHSSGVLAYRTEATVLRRIASRMEELRAAAGGAAPSGTPSTSDADEVVRLRAELAKAQDELDRIKKRLAQPKPPR